MALAPLAKAATLVVVKAQVRPERWHTTHIAVCLATLAMVSAFNEWEEPAIQ